MFSSWCLRTSYCVDARPDLVEKGREAQKRDVSRWVVYDVGCDEDVTSVARKFAPSVATRASPALGRIWA